MAAEITKLAGKYRLSFLAATVGTTGASATNDMGLTGITSAYATRVSTAAGNGDGIPCSISLNYATSSGNVAVYAWEVDGTAATAGTITVHITALGT